MKYYNIHFVLCVNHRLSYSQRKSVHDIFIRINRKNCDIFEMDFDPATGYGVEGEETVSSSCLSHSFDGIESRDSDMYRYFGSFGEQSSKTEKTEKVYYTATAPYRGSSKEMTVGFHMEHLYHGYYHCPHMTWIDRERVSIMSSINPRMVHGFKVNCLG